ncbi:MAG TPA: hypothetical protein VNM92_10800 [Thermoanaerobaculia bacterium]|nr:hypothetical protein [Thermoanaerobaculia bacterium]
MKNSLIRLALAISSTLLVACSVEKTSSETYEVKTPSREEVNRKTETARTNAREAGKDIKEGARTLGDEVREGGKAVAQSETGQEIKEGAKVAGAEIKEAGREAASATGRALERAGKSMQKHAKPGDQP